MILNYSFYRSQIVPRWISVWGLLGAALVVAFSLASMVADLDPFSATAILLFLPIAVNEMVLAAWLVIKGFSRAGMLSESA